MTDNRLLQRFREIVREEIRRDRCGTRCPECGATDQSWSLFEIDEMVADSESHTLACYNCEYQGPPETYDPLNQGGR